MIRKIPLELYYEAEALWYLQQQSYRIEAAFIGLRHLPPLLETVESLQRSNETFLGYYMEDELTGALSYKVEGNKVRICRLMVHSDHFRQGVASALLTHLFENVKGEQYTVSASVRNKPALKLYEKHHFVATREVMPMPGIPLMLMHRSANPDIE